MTSLSARIAILLCLAILAVVGLATLAASRALEAPSPEATIEPVASQIHLLARLAETDREALLAAGGRVDAEPAEGEILERMSRFLTHALARTGPQRMVLVSRPVSGAPDAAGEGVALLASVDLGAAGWLITPVPDPAPPEGRWRILAIWLGVIVTGSGLVSVYAARRLMQPLVLLEESASRIGADARLSPVPETGPAEVRATARALNGLAERLSQAMESRMRLVAAAGHDLRTPMTRMRLRAEFVEDDTERTRWLADLDELDQIADSAIRLVREEVSPGPVEPLRADLLVQEVAEELGALGLPVTLGPLVEARVRARPLALRRALRNLIINAATHGGGAEVSMAAADGPGGPGVLLRIVIADRGPGIPDELLSQALEPFFRVDPARRKTMPGAGLGLAIAREIIENAGGTLSIRNRHPSGLLQEVVLRRG